jgi:uncharacterized membrane protein YkoI
MLAGSVVGSGGAFAQTPSTTPAQAAATPTPGSTQSEPTSPNKGDSGSSTITAKITQQQAEQAALAASPGSTIDHTILQNQNGTPVYDVDFTNGGGVLVNGDTGAVITVEAAGTDQGGRGRRGGHGARGGADQAALAAQATVTKDQAEQAALTASPGKTIDHSILQDHNGTIVWDVDFDNGGGVIIDAKTGAVIIVEAAGTDQGGHGGLSNAPSSTPTPQS